MELIGYLSGVSYSCIEDLDAIYVFCFLFSTANGFRYPLPSFEKAQLNIKMVGLTLVSFRM